jgi:hypothetical protein
VLLGVADLGDFSTPTGADRAPATRLNPVKREKKETMIKKKGATTEETNDDTEKGEE